MARCAYCKTQETQTYENDVPICIACATDKDVERAADRSRQDGRQEEKLALREAPGTLDKRAAERRRIAERAVELQRMGVSKPAIAQRLGVKYGQLRACLVEFQRMRPMNSGDLRA